MPWIFPLVQLAVTAVARKVLSQAVVLTLWEIARRTPGTVDDEAIRSVAAGLGVTLPEPPTAPEKDVG